MPIRYLSPKHDVDAAKMNWDTLLIDFDGTLVDYYYSERMALTDLLLDQGLEASKLDDAIKTYQKINDGYWKKFEQDLLDIEQVKTQRFSDLADHYGLEINPSEFNENYLEHFILHVKPYPGAMDALKMLYTKTDYNLIVITNGIDYVQKRRMENTGYDKLVHHLITSGGVGYSKPSPEIFDVSLNLVGSSCEFSCMIGDSLSSDITGAKNLGIKSCLIDEYNQYKRSEPKPDMIANNFVEFVEWLQTT